MREKVSKTYGRISREVKNLIIGPFHVMTSLYPHNLVSLVRNIVLRSQRVL